MLLLMSLDSSLAADAARYFIEIGNLTFELLYSYTCMQAAEAEAAQ